MNEIMRILIEQVIIMFILMMSGYILFKTKLINEKATQSISNIVLYVAIPATIINSFICEFDMNKLINGGITFIFSFVIIGVSILMINLLFRKMPDLTKFGIIFCNVGFLGIPLVKNVLGEECVFYITMYVVMINIFVWTYGIWLVSKDKREISIKKIITNPTFIMIGLGFLILSFSIQIPSVLQLTINHFGNISAPLSMIVLGCYLAEADLKSLFKDASLYKICLGRNIVIPLITLVLLKVLPLNIEEVKLVLLIGASTPVAGIMGMFCQKYGRDYAYGAGVIGVSTLLSLVTMPIILYLYFLI